MLALVFVAILSTALAVQPAGRIVGGTPTTIEQQPYMANVQLLNSPLCGGTLINNRAVLSAAHCIIFNIPSFYRVILGSTAQNGAGGSHYSVSRIIVHPGYDGNTLTFDAAILHLAPNVVYTSRITPARIGNFALSPGTPLKAVGWGALWTGGPTSPTLQEVTVNYVDQNICDDRYVKVNQELEDQNANYRYPPITSDMLCAGILDVGGKDACQGDSGGPLLSGDIVVGITSWGHECASAKAPGVYSRVSQISSWITNYKAEEFVCLFG